MTTLNASGKWVVELYPFKSPIPSADDFEGASAPSLIAGTKSATKTIMETLKSVWSSPESQNKEINKFLGITAVNLKRSKGAPDGECQISMVGPLPPEFYVGVWATVSSVSQNEEGVDVSVTRFIGQIENIDISYDMEANGLLAIRSSAKLREWSAMLRMLVRYDVMSIAAQALNNPVGQFATLAAGVKPSFGPLNKGESATYQNISKIMESAFDPFEFAQIILAFIGALNLDDATQSVKQYAENVELPNVATIAPYIPQGLMKRLGVGSGSGIGGLSIPKIPGIGSSNPKNPFQSGFMQTIIGIQTRPFYSYGGWDGVFRDEKIKDLAENYHEGYKNNSIQPLSSGIQALMSSGASAWDLLSSQCDNAINEVYTDFLYEATDPDVVVGKPVLVVRNKPFMLKKLQQNEIKGISIESGVDLSQYSVYDNLPRHQIPDYSIIAFRINSTILNSPNYIRVNYTPSAVSNRTGEAASLAAGLERLEPEMKRFGGNELELNTIYNGTEKHGISNEKESSGVKLDDWYKQLKNLGKLWYSYSYRMGTGILVIKEAGLPLSIGNNVQFNMGEYKLVGHIESVVCDFQIEADGLETNTTTLMLSHIVQSTESGLDFIDMTHFGNLLQSTPTESEPGSGLGSALSSIAGAAKGFFT